MFRALKSEIVREAEGAAGGGSADKPADTPADPGTLLYGDAKPAAKPADAKADDASKPAGEKATAEADKAAPEDDKSKADEKPADDATLKEVPTDGKYEFKLADGIELDAALAERAMPALHEAGVTREQANKLAAFIASERKAEAEAMASGFEKTIAEWGDKSKADAEYGGEKFAVSLERAQAAISKFGSPELSEYLNASGGGNHPEVIRFMVKVGNAFSDDKPVAGGGASSSNTDPVSILYGT